MANPGNPLERAHSPSPSSAISTTTYPIAGILCTVYGLDELPSNLQELACLWLLHPRLQTQKSMAPTAVQAINLWNSRLREREGSSHSQPVRTKGLIAVTFDQRNHGDRLVDALANEAWRSGNKRHAQDMYSIYQGTAQDTSLLLRHLPSYLPAHLAQLPLTHHALGVSLGAHAAWHLVIADPRIRTAAILIGCPDYTRLMLQRAAKSRLPAFTAAGAGPARAADAFLASTDFPPALRSEIARSDPAALLLPEYLQAPNDGNAEVREEDRERLRRKLDGALKGKSIFALSGASDKLVPYKEGEVFYRFLRGAVGNGQEGWWRESECAFVEKVYDGVGHEVSPEMARDALRFLVDVVLDGKKGGEVLSSRL